MDELREDKNWQTYYISPSISIKCLAASRSSYCPRPLSSYTEVLSSSGIIVRWSQDVVIWAVVGILGWANGDAPPRDRSSGVSLGKCALIWDRLFLTRF